MPNSRNPILIGKAELLVDDDEISVQPRAGDVVRVRGWLGLWMCYGGVGNREEGGPLRFARFPHVDRVQTFDVSLVYEIILPCEFEEAQRAWELIEQRLRSRESGTFAEKVFVYRPCADDKECAAVIYAADGTELGAHISSTMQFARFDMDRHIPQHCEVVWCIGRAELQAQIDAGELRGLTFEQGDETAAPDPAMAARPGQSE